MHCETAVAVARPRTGRGRPDAAKGVAATLVNRRSVHTRRSAGAAIAAALLVSALPAGATPLCDLFMRQSIVAIRPASAPRGADVRIEGTGVTALPRSAARSCDARGCTFDLGVEALRISKDLPLVTAVRLAVSGGASARAAVRFSGLDLSARTVIRLPIPFGRSTLSAKVDPDDRIPESDETNNGFSVEVLLRAPR